MTDALFLWGGILLPLLGIAALRLRRRNELRQYGRAQVAQQLLARGYSAGVTMPEAQRIERAKRKGLLVVRTHRKTYTRAAK